MIYLSRQGRRLGVIEYLILLDIPSYRLVYSRICGGGWYVWVEWTGDAARLFEIGVAGPNDEPEVFLALDDEASAIGTASAIAQTIATTKEWNADSSSETSYRIDVRQPEVREVPQTPVGRGELPRVRRPAEEMERDSAE